MLTALKWIIFIIAILLLGLLSYGTVYIFDWKSGWAMWAVLVTYLAAIAIAILIVRIIMFWRKRRNTEEAMELRRQEKEEKQVVWSRRSSLSRQWKSMVQQLQKSKFKTKGNAVYALPWYLMLGQPQSGKTSAIKNSKLSVPFSGQSGGAEQGYVGGSRWWFLEETMVLDVPGYYILHRNNTDRNEWRQFLGLLMRHRKQQPLNGVVLTIPVDSLLNDNDNQLNEQAANLRERLNDLVQRLGINFPVYVLVTKCDHVQGLTKFFEHFPDDVLNQAMGVMNDRYAEQGVPVKFLDRAFRRMGRRLDRLRVTLLGNVNPLQLDAKAIIFPEEFKILSGKLARMVKLVFEKRSYHESPYFRGIFFSSSLQEGQPVSSILPNIGFAEENLPLSGGSTSYFLRDFFGKILRRDKNLVSATRRAINLRSMAHNIGALAWIAFCVILAILISISFTRNLTTLRQAAGDIPATIAVSGDVDNDMKNLDRFRLAIYTLVARNDDWWLPRLGLSQSRDVEEKLAGVYTKKFYNYVLKPVDRDLLRSVKSLHRNSQPLIIAQYIDLFSKRITLLESVRKQDDWDPAQSQKDLPNFRFMLGDKRVPRKNSKLPSQMKLNYVAYLSWERDGRLLQTEYDKQRANLKRILSQEDLGLNWLTSWANIQESLEDVTLKSFWDGNPTGPRIYVPRAYTAKGWIAISGFIKKIQRVQVAKELIEVARKDYIRRYRYNYFLAWENFLKDFHKGETLWKGREQRLELATLLSTSESPFNKIMKTANVAMAPAIKLADNKEKQVPYWVWHFQRFLLLQQPKYKQSLKGSDGVLGLGGKFLDKMRDDIAGSGDNEESRFATDRKALPLVEAYISTIEEMAETAAASKAAFKIAKQTFDEADTVVGEPKISVLKNDYSRRKLKRLIGQAGRPEQEVFWQLLHHQFRILWKIMLSEAQKHLQNKWSEDVMADVANMDEAAKKETLQAEGGKVWQFRDQHIKPFLRRNQPKVLFDEQMHFTAKFISVLNAGPIKPVEFDKECKVAVEGLPTDTNRDAAVKPNRTTLILTCNQETNFTHVNNNPPPKLFSWKQSECGKVSLDIRVGELELKREWDDFPAFIRDFRARQGRKIFYRQEFDFQKRGQLTGYGIKHISVHYRFRPKSQVKCVLGGGPARKPQVPENIIEAKYIKR